MKITFDPTKREEALHKRGLDFYDAVRVFVGDTLEFDDERFDYGERRVISVGRLDGRMVIVGWTPRGGARHVFTMRKANEREQKNTGTDWAKADAYENTADDYAELPELTDDRMDRAVLVRGRPAVPGGKSQIALRVDNEVLDAFRRGGPGWQSRMNEALRKAAGLGTLPDQMGSSGR